MQQIAFNKSIQNLFVTKLQGFIYFNVLISQHHKVSDLFKKKEIETMK